MTLVIATKNKGKIKEIKELLEGLPVKLLFLNDFQCLPEIKEDGLTFKQNALKKAEGISEATGYPALADDSGLEVDILQGRPGIHSARFAGEKATDPENIKKLLGLMENIPEGKRKARFKAVVCLYFPDGKKCFGEGICEGRIIFAPRGNNGFGYDPVFIPDGYDKTFAELSEGIKNKISHRAKAFEEMKRIILKNNM